MIFNPVVIKNSVLKDNQWMIVSGKEIIMVEDGYWVKYKMLVDGKVIIMDEGRIPL